MIEALKLILANLPVYGALLATLLLFALFMDWRIKEELKAKFVSWAFGHKASRNTPLLGQVSIFYQVATSLFGTHSFFSFVRRTLLISTLTLTCLALLQAATNRSGFEQTTLPFFKNLISLDSTALTIIAGVAVVDLISTYRH